MALKDWKKLNQKGYNELAHFKNIKSQQEIFIQTDVYGITVIVVGKGREYFNTKSQALSFAKKYMRSH